MLLNSGSTRLFLCSILYYYFCHKTYSTIFPFISVSLLMLIVDVPSRIIIIRKLASNNY